MTLKINGLELEYAVSDYCDGCIAERGVGTHQDICEYLECTPSGLGGSEDPQYFDVPKVSVIWIKKG